LTLKPIDVRFFAGTELTTPQEIKQVFEKAKGVAKEVVTGLVFIDELGLAEISEKNPLKVLHPYLEEKGREYGFVSISNWVLDLSKMNRMIFLARPELNSTELMDIFKKFITVADENKTETLRTMMEGLLKAYLRFRSFEKRWIKRSEQNKHYFHRDFHGSRDIYGMYNYLGAYWNKAIEKGVNEQMTLSQMHHLLIEAIERNMNGEIYTFENPEAITKDEEPDKWGKPMDSRILDYLREEFTILKRARQDLI
jgi:hypothetical protein